MDLMVCLAYIQLTEHFGSPKARRKIPHIGKGVTIQLRNAIQAMEVPRENGILHFASE
uniref:Uncharacterized protein n=1 Tax=Lepeophtheirus salmonis TaxID=72036 RepID=A0A0K2TMF1_LEPSM